jgi:hypothetical protein
MQGRDSVTRYSLALRIPQYNTRLQLVNRPTMPMRFVIDFYIYLRASPETGLNVLCYSTRDVLAHENRMKILHLHATAYV